MYGKHVCACVSLQMNVYECPQTQPRCSMNILNLFICCQTYGICCHCPTCMLGCIHVYDHTLCVLCGKYIPQDAICGETLKQPFSCCIDSKSSLHLHKPEDINLSDPLSHKTAQRCFFENTQYLQFIFQFGIRGQGLFKHELFILDMHPMDNSGQRVSSPSPDGRCDAGHRGH